MPKGAPPPDPFGPPPQGKATYADLVEAVRIAYPGRFDQEDPADLAEVVLETYPHLRDAVDHTTKGMELLPGNQGGPRTSRDFQKNDKGEWVPKYGGPGRMEMTPELEKQLGNNRQANWGDTLVTAGLRTVPALAGGAAGAAISAVTANPLPAYGGLFVGGSAGEAAAQLYERAAGISEEISPGNIIAQGALNMVPVAGLAKSGAAGAARLVGANALKGGAVRRGAAAVVNATRATNLPARMASGALEGAVTSAGGAGLEIGFEKGRLPTFEEAAGAALGGAAFGGALPVGGELWRAGKRARAKPALRAANAVIDSLDTSRGGQVLPVDARNAATQQVIATIEKAAQLDPQGGKAAYAKLLSVLDGQHQADLQIKAAGFLQKFSEVSPDMSDGQRLDIAKQFLDRVKQDGLAAEHLDGVVTTLAGIDTNARMAQAAGGMKMLPPAPPEALLGAGGRDILPLEPRLAEGPGGPAIAVDPEGAALLRGREDLGTPPPLVADQPAGPRPVITGRFREAAPPPPPPGPPSVDWSRAKGSDELGFDRAAERAQRTAAAQGVEGIKAGLLPYARQERLPGLPEVPNLPPAPPKSLEGIPTIGAVAEGPSGQNRIAEGVDMLHHVRAGTIDRDSAVMLQVLRQELREFGYQPAEAKGKGIKRDQAQEHYDGESEFKKNQATPRVASTKTARTIARILGKKPEALNRRELQQQIENFLSGRQSQPSPTVRGVLKYVGLLKKAWDGEHFDIKRLTPHDVREAGLGTGKLTDVHLPVLGPGQVLSLDEADDLLGKYAPNVLEEKRGLQADAILEDGLPTGAEPRAGAAPEGASQFFAGLSPEELKLLHGELLAQGPDGAQYRSWLADHMEQRGLARPEQAMLVEETPAATPPPPSDQLLALEEAAAGGGVPRGTPDVVADAPAVAPVERPLSATERLKAADAAVFGDEATPFDRDLETLAAADPDARPLDLLGDEGGAVGTPAQRAAARQRILKNLAESDGAPRNFRMDEGTLAQVQKVVGQAGDTEEAGLLVGTPDGQIRRVIRSRNIAEDTADTFEIDPRTIAAAQKRAQEEGLVLLGSWHSQPTGSAEPSRADLRGGVADLPMLIIGAKGGEVRDVRVWQPRGKSAWKEGSLDIGDLSRRPGDVPTTKKSVQATIRKIPRFTGAMGDDAALGTYLSTHAAELDTEPFFHKAQAALEAGNPRKAWLELQIAQVAYGNLSKAAAQNLPYQEGVDVARQLAGLEAGSPQSAAGQLWALYDGRTVWAPGVGRIVVTPDLPPALRGKGVQAGPGGVLRPGAAVEGAMPDMATQERLTLNVVNDVLKDVDAVRVLDDPTKEVRLFRQVAEQMLLSPANFKAIRTLGGDEAQVAAHFQRTVTESARVLAALSQWKRQHGEAIRKIEGIKGASGEADLVIRGKGRTVGRLSDLYQGQTFDALVAEGGNAWDRVILLQALTPGQIGKFDQLGRASRGFMLSQWSTALRNVYSSTGRWGSDMIDASLKGLAYTTTGDFDKAKVAFQKVGDLARYAPILRPDGWVMPWRARSSAWEQIFDTSGQILSMGKDREAVLSALKAVPEKAAAFMGGTGFGETVNRGQSSSTILNALASEKVQQTLTMFNRAQEFTIRSAMLHVALNEQLRLRGLDPHTALSLPPDRLRAVLGEDGYTQVFDKAVGEALNFTFAGDLIRKGYGNDPINRPKGAANTEIIDILNKLPIVREGYPFAKFNLSAAPRYLWDHSGLGLLVEPLYSKVAKRGRYHLGTTGKRFRDELIPEIDQKVADAQVKMGKALNTWQGMKDEITARRRLDARYQKMTVAQANLPDIADKMRANTTALEALEAKSMEAGEAYNLADGQLRDLLSQKAKTLETVAAAAAADAPEDFQTLFARNMTGAAVMLPLAMMIRASQKDEGTPWYKVKVGDNLTADLRPFAPFVQYLFVADVLQDFYDNTDWAGVSEDLDLGKYSWDNLGEAFFKGGRYDGAHSADDIAKGFLAMVSAPLWDLVETPGSVYQFYEGKYTSQSLGKEILNVAASTSQLAGTTLSLVEAIADIGTEGLPGTEKGFNLVANTVGQMLARFTMPFAQFKGLSALYDDEERYARIADQGEEMSAAPLGQFLGNLPFVGAAAIPETYNQLTGQPLASQYPLLRSLGGVTLGSWDAVSGEITRIGMPGASVYIRKTGDIYVDKLVGYHYAALVQQYLPQLLNDPNYQKLDSAALRRDAMGKVLPKLKKAAIGYTTMDLGVERIKSAQAGSETRRRQARVERLQRLLVEENLNGLVEEEPDEPEEQDAPEMPEVEEQELPPGPPQG